MVRLASISDLETILALIQRVVAGMHAKGIDQWHDKYPNRAVISNDIKNSWLYLLEQDDSLAGMIVLNREYDKQYDALSWLTPANSSLYVHRLAVDPVHQGKGLGKFLMDFAEATAQEEGMLSVRLDTYTGNPGNMAMYTKRGYATIGEVNLPQYRPMPFVCYEKLLHD